MASVTASCRWALARAFESDRAESDNCRSADLVMIGDAFRFTRNYD